MKATGIVRRIDDLGRVVIPKEIRRTLRLKEGTPLEIFTDREGCPGKIRRGRGEAGRNSCRISGTPDGRLSKYQRFFSQNSNLQEQNLKWMVQKASWQFVPSIVHRSQL